MDPKSVWALRNRHMFPVDVNTAPKEMLARVPGFGMRNVERIIEFRRIQKLTSFDLRKMRVVWKKARYFVCTADHNPDVNLLDKSQLQALMKPENKQLSLFDSLSGVVSGEV